METVTSIALPDVLPYFFGILGLLLLWQYYQIQVMKGRILAIDIFDRSGVRMYLYAVSEDPQTCEVCRSAHGTVFPPSEVMRAHFAPVKGTCKNPNGCIGFLVGLYGAWPEANRIVERLRMSPKREPIQLSQHELMDLVLGSWERSISASTDQPAVYILEALLGETEHPKPAIEKYRRTIDYAKEIRHMPLIVPAYFRLVDLLAQQGQTAEALYLIAEFEKRFKENSQPYGPTTKQIQFMKLKKSRLESSARATHLAPTA